MKDKLKDEKAKIMSTFMKDVIRLKKHATNQMRMNVLRKHQIKLLNTFLKKLLKEGRITKEELKIYMPRKKDIEKRFFMRFNSL